MENENLTIEERVAALEHQVALLTHSAEMTQQALVINGTIHKNVQEMFLLLAEHVDIDVGE